MTKLTHEQFMRSLNDVWDNNIPFVVLTSYVKTNEHLYITDEYGTCKVMPLNLLKGKKPTIRSAVNKTEYFKSMVRKNNPKCQFEILGEYINHENKILVETRFGHCEIRTKDCLRTVCPTFETALNPVAYRTKMTELQSHLPNACSLEQWEKLAKNSGNFDSFKVYIIECWDENTGEHFHKIGRTFLTMGRRFGRQTNNSIIPYRWKTINITEGEADKMYDLELELQGSFFAHRYIPEKSFRGAGECFDLTI